MKIRTLTLFLLLIAMSFAGNSPALAKTKLPAQEQGREQAFKERHEAFSNADFDRFHDILHPLQHEALPKNDFATIRREARRLVTAGRPLTRMAVPPGIAETAKFCEEQARFTDALKRFDRAAQRKDDNALKRSYIQVHDTFEEMAHLLPRR
jgi:cytochrome c556